MSNTFLTIIAVIGPIITLLTNEFFHWLRDKRRSEERFFYEIFPMRLKAYEEILRTIPQLLPTNAFSDDPEPKEFIGIINNILHSLEKLLERTAFITSPNVFDRLRDIGKLINRYIEKPSITSLEVGVQKELASKFWAEFNSIYDDIVELVRAESGIHIIDKKITKFRKKVPDVVGRKHVKGGKDKNLS